MRPGPAKSEVAVGRGEQVLDAAAAVFARKGYDGSSIDDIADEMGATKGRVYHYYRSKADILAGVLTVGAQRLIDVVRPIAEDEALSVGERLLQMARAHALMMMEQHAYQKVTLQSFDLLVVKGSSNVAWQSVLSSRAEYEELFLAIVRKGQRQGSFAKSDARVVVRSLLGALNWITVWYRPDSGADAKARRLSNAQIADTAAHFVVTGVRGDTGSTPGPPGRLGDDSSV